mgnify:CR=1 FL=1|jgi:ribonucleotide reductase beta subunit family protein with ferritin-like domain
MTDLSILSEEALLLELEYKNQYPKEENPFDWMEQFIEEDLISFMQKREGRKVLVNEVPDVTDSGELYYGV